MKREEVGESEAEVRLIQKRTVRINSTRIASPTRKRVATPANFLSNHPCTAKSNSIIRMSGSESPENSELVSAIQDQVEECKRQQTFPTARTKLIAPQGRPAAMTPFTFLSTVAIRSYQTLDRHAHTRSLARKKLSLATEDWTCPCHWLPTI